MRSCAARVIVVRIIGLLRLGCAFRSAIWARTVAIDEHAFTERHDGRNGPDTDDRSQFLLSFCVDLGMCDIREIVGGLFEDRCSSVGRCRSRASLSVGKLAEGVVSAGTVNGGRPAVHEEGDPDGFRRLLLRGSRPGRRLGV